MKDYNIMLEKRREYLIGGTDISDTILESFNRVGKEVFERLKRVVEENGYLEYRDNIVVIKELYGDILNLAKVYKTDRSLFYNKKEVLDLMERALLIFEREYYNKGSKEHTNWWQWEIGIPLILNNIFVLLKDDVSFDMVKRNLETSRYFQPDARYSGNNPVAIHPSGNPLRLSSGGNRTDTVKVSFFRGILLEDEKEIREALEALEDVWKYKDGDEAEDRDGFYRDGSFIQHGSIAYAGGYGEVLLTGLGEIFYTIRDTAFSKYIRGLDTLYEIIFNSFEPFFYKGRFTDMLSGRGITRENNSDRVIGHRILNDILLISSAFSGEKRESLERFISREIFAYGKNEYLSEENSPFIYTLLIKLLKKDECEKYPSQVKVTNRMNRVMKREESFAIGLAMHSYEVGNYEAMNGENLKGWYTGDGAYYLYDEDSQGYKEYWKNVDMYFIPGTTEIKMDMEGIDAQRNSETSFVSNKKVGAVELDNTGIAVMDYTNWNERLNSKKAWIFLSGKTIFIENQIESQDEVYTTIFNKKYIKLPEIYCDGNKITDKYLEKNLKEIVIDEWKIEFDGVERVKIEIEEKADFYFVKIWKEYEKGGRDTEIIWSLVNLKSKKITEVLSKKIEKDRVEVETDGYRYQINWTKNDICTIESKVEQKTRKLTIE